MKIESILRDVIIIRLFAGLSMISAIAVSSRAFASLWGFCDANKQAWADANYSIRKAEADKVCALPTATDTGDAVQLNTNRCLNSQVLECSAEALAASGLVPGGFGSNDVPQNAWYVAGSASTNSAFALIRCACGCFTPDTNILTANGWQRIDVLKENSGKAKDRVLIPAMSQGLLFKPSPFLKPIAFTKGPEEKPVIRIQTADNLAVEMTELHPVPIKLGKNMEMVQAKTLKVGDEVYDMKGETQKITKISMRKLSKENNSVYNLNTYGHGDSEHIVVANGIRVGDLGWQNKLAERAQRSENILKYNR